MPILLILLMVLLVATIGFWDTLGALLGIFGVVLLLIVLGAGAAWILARRYLDKVRGRLR